MKEFDVDPKELQAFGIWIMRPNDPRLRSLKTSSIPSYHGHKPWHSTWVLLSYLENHPLDSHARVLDVGCGWGLAGIACILRFQSQVTAVDVDPKVFPFLKKHAEINSVEVATETVAFNDVSKELLCQQDVLIGSDICFHENMIAQLISLITRARTAGINKVILSDPGRPSFRSLVAHCAEKFDAKILKWQTPEPLVPWPGDRPNIQGELLVING